MTSTPRYKRIGPYIISLDYIHGVMQAKTDNKDVPYQVIITYTDKACVCLDMPSFGACEEAFLTIASALNAL